MSDYAKCIDWLQSDVYMIKAVFLSILKFAGILLFCSLICSVLYINADIDPPELDEGGDDFPSMPYWIKVLLFSYSNSIGDLRMPEVTKWNYYENI